MIKIDDGDENDRKLKHENNMIKGRTVFTTRIFTQRRPCSVG